MEPGRALVIGAGIGGTAAALALARKGWRVTVEERAPEAGEVGAGLQISPNGVKVLRALGVEPPGARAGAVRLVDMASGGEVLRVPLGQTVEDRHGAPFLQVHRADLLSALLAACETAGVTLKFGREADAAALARGLDSHQADLIVAADGVRSATRRTLFAGIVPRFSGLTAWRALVPGTWPEESTVFMAPGRHVVVYPLKSRSMVNIVAVEPRTGWESEGWAETGDPERMRAAFSKACPELRSVLARIDRTILWGLFAHPPLPRMAQGRVALLGDAAHPMQPFLAQGATQSIEDAWVLAERLHRHGSLPEALAEYSLERLPRVTRVQQGARFNAFAWHLGTPLRPAVHAALRIGAGLAPMAPLRRFDWLYGHDVTARD